MTWHFDYSPPASEGSSVLMVSRWLWPGNLTFLEVASMVVTWWIVAFFAQWIDVVYGNDRNIYAMLSSTRENLLAWYQNTMVLNLFLTITVWWLEQWNCDKDRYIDVMWKTCESDVGTINFQAVEFLLLVIWFMNNHDKGSYKCIIHL